MCPGTTTYINYKKGVDSVVLDATVLINDKAVPAGDKKGFFAQNERIYS